MKALLVGIALTGAMTLLVHELAIAFNVTGLLLTVYTLIPVFAGIGLLIAALLLID